MPSAQQEQPIVLARRPSGQAPKADTRTDVRPPNLRSTHNLISVFPSLPRVVREVNEIAATFSSFTESVTVDLEATTNSLIECLSGVPLDILHITSHGVSASLGTLLGGPKRGGLIMQPESSLGSARIFTTEDLFAAPMTIHGMPRLVTLSAGATATGESAEIDGRIGLGEGFFSKGCASVVAVLWEVDDSSTSQLMGDFYRSVLNGCRLTVALQNAVKRLRYSRPIYQHPCYWGAFCVSGNGDALISS
jgi:CHAT domain-containing protein